ncbi:uncharacterized protein Z519_02747 [Cladophialophora bantiana CBS 173.52]|uniref:VLRF1 domain-containing protein n=1 Tax=Cladophialophora bantiana (strain ATCC 10958 / CBS 173.52 / CDC B-1940 / NIH 8579) TaxID=1442370 RepID=A0A0D2I2B6_CLAB1|nr:uncharacterized protein Z519_02747 [Cladophialophora bantiana CBS 173.52]KIW97355.1 hypothetical protein Z519_02747 [Cladophialophora bantiana CBS 173.52]
MADKARTDTNPFLRWPLYVYDLPPELLFTFTLAGGEQPQAQAQESQSEARPPSRQNSLGEDGIATSTSCALCKVAFDNVQDQRLHVKSDFHRYNLKLSIKGISPIDESTFTRMIGDLDESLSGSDSEESDEDDVEDTKGGDNTLTALLRRQARISHPQPTGDTEGSKKRGFGNAPLLWLSSPRIGNDVGLGIYRAILSNEEQEQASTSLVEILKTKQLKPTMPKQGGRSHGGPTHAGANDPHFFLCMIGGGHFAAMVVSLVPELRKGPGGIEERHAVVRAHKTFHRYTTRRKQGGSQTANDNAKGNAHSAGSSIRRYNEMALEADVRAVLSEWKEMIDSAELLFIRATGSTNRRTLFGPYDGQVLRSNDKRIRGFPFNTRRATQAELLRSFHELTRLKVGKFVEPAAEKRSLEKPATKPKPKPQASKLSEEEETARFHTSQLQGLIRRSKAPGVLLYLTKNELSPDFTFFPPSDHHHAPTPLHFSASTNSPALVLALLTKAKADPTIRNGDGRTAYDIAGDPKTRDAFRIARHQLGDSAFDWSAAHVPSPLSQEEADAKAVQEKAASNAAEAQRRKAGLEHLRLEEEKRNLSRMEKKAGAGKTLAVAAAEKTGAEKREEEVRGLTPEMRMRLERERRARAAEERIRRMQGAG